VSVRVLDVELFDKGIPQACAVIIREIEAGSRQSKCVSATGAHGIVHARENRDFRDILSRFYMNLPDGMPGVWIGRLKGAKEMQRCYGPDVFRQLMQMTANKPIRHFFCGGLEGVAEELKLAVANKFGNKNIVGTYCPPHVPVDKYDYAAIAQTIRLTNPDIIWIGLSTPKQEVFASKLALHVNVGFIVTVGAAFDFHTDRVPQAPGILQKAGLEWFYRLIMEPRRLFSRYRQVVPRFIYYNLREFFSFAGQKKT